MKLNRVSTEHAGLIAHLNQAVHALHFAAHPDFFRNSSLEEITASFQEYLARENLYAFAVFSDSEEAVGYIMAFLKERPGHAFVHPQKLLIIDQIAVLPDYHRQGYGKALVDIIKSLAEDLGVDKIALDTWAFNHQAQAFFKKQGFEIYNLRLWMDA